jgi:hypothetical protein
VANAGDEIGAQVRRHVAIGWGGLALFSIAGLLLEALHGLKVPLYLDVGAEPRRLLWTLAHAHGSLLSIVNLAFAFYLSSTGGGAATATRRASRLLVGGLVLLPAGFALGGLWLHGGDPGIGILLAPIGGAAFVGAMIVLAIDSRNLARPDARPDSEPGADRVERTLAKPGRRSRR